MTLHIHLLGEFLVRDEERNIPPSAWEHRRAADVVKLLALNREHRLVKEVVLEALWPQLDPSAATAALHKAASHGRKVLGGERLVLKQGEVALAPDEKVTTDVELFEDAARRALSSGNAGACAKAATLYGGELLPGDRYAEWATAHRDRLAAQHLELLRRAGAWEQLVAHDPLDEAAQLKLMRLYADAGNRAAALRQFQRMRQLFAVELGVSPSAEATSLYEQLSRGPAVHAPVAAATELFGREVELARVRTLLRKVKDGVGHTLVVRGDAGMGKTSFCERVLLEAARDGATTLRGGTQLDGGAYAPVIEAIDQLMGARPDLAAALPEGSRQVLARLATAVPFEPGDEQRALSRQRVLSAVGQLLTSAARERSVVLFLDDIHEADDSTVELWHYLAQLARANRILLIVAMRPDQRSTLARTRASLVSQRALSELELGPLSRSEVAKLVGRVTASAADERAAEVIHARAGGNPLFAELLATAVAPHQDLPSDLNTVIEGVLMRAGEEAIALLRRVAVLGVQFTAQELLGLAGTSEDAALALLDRCLAARIVEDIRGTYRFHHALYVDSLLRGMPTHRLREAHRTAATMLVETGATASRVARQLLAADAPSEAVAWLIQAAREETQVAAYASALQSVELALEHGGPDPQVLAMRAQLLFVTGSPEAPAAYARAAEVVPEANRPALRVHQARAHMALGDVPSAAGIILAMAPPEDAQALVIYWIMRGQVAWFSGQAEEADNATRTARELAEKSGDEAGIVEAVLARGIVDHSRGAYAENVGADLLGDHSPQLAGLIHEGHLCISTGYLESGLPYPKVDEFARELRANGERIGAKRAVAFSDLVRGETSLLSGTLQGSSEFLKSAEDLSLDVGARSAASLAVLRRAQLAITQGDHAGAKALLAEALTLAQGTVQGQRHLLQRIYGSMIRAEQDPARAVAIVDESEVAVVGPAESCMGCGIALLVPASIACACAGQHERAAGKLAMAEQVGAALWPRGPWQAALEEARAALATARGDVTAGSAHLSRAQSLYAESGQHGEAARCARGVAAVFTLASA